MVFSWRLFRIDKAHGPHRIPAPQFAEINTRRYCTAVCSAVVESNRPAV
jgi:hypothetical protein